jgi:hypothetical protein
VITTLLLTPSSFALKQIRCVQPFDHSTNNGTGIHYVVDIIEIEEITPKNQQHSFDNVHLVNVKVGLEHEYGRSAEVLKDFYTLSTNENASYTIESLKQNGFALYLSLDNMDQAGMIIDASYGSFDSENLNCKYL